MIAAVGDIACKNPPGNNRKVCQYDDVAALIERGDYDKFLPLGDIQYEKGSYKDYRENYDVYFGDLMSISEPVPGNHDYGVTDANGYYRYFGELAHGPDGYYSYDLGAWHVIALNSAICPAVTGCGPGDPQYRWLKADLAANDAACTLAYWHHPRYDWLKYQNADWTEDYEFLRTAPFWNLLYDAGAELVLSGHNHNYSRWQPMDKDLSTTPTTGSCSSSPAQVAATSTRRAARTRSRQRSLQVRGRSSASSSSPFTPAATTTGSARPLEPRATSSTPARAWPATSLLASDWSRDVER